MLTILESSYCNVLLIALNVGHTGKQLKRLATLDVSVYNLSSLLKHHASSCVSTHVFAYLLWVVPSSPLYIFVPFISLIESHWLVDVVSGCIPRKTRSRILRH